MSGNDTENGPGGDATPRSLGPKGMSPMDKQILAEIMERDIARLKAFRPHLASRIERAEHILVTQLSVTNGSRPVKVRVHADGSRSYRVASGSKLARSYAVSPATWGCECPDHGRRRAACKHALACWVLERAYRPSPVGFEEAPHGCYDGLVYIGHLVEDPETGEEVEVFEAAPCRRCNR